MHRRRLDLTCFFSEWVLRKASASETGTIRFSLSFTRPSYFCSFEWAELQFTSTQRNTDAAELTKKAAIYADVSTPDQPDG